MAICIFLLFISLGFCHCGNTPASTSDATKPTPQEPAAPTQPEKQKPPPDAGLQGPLNAKLIELTSPNHFAVDLEWHQAANADYWLVQREDSSFQIRLLTKVEEKVREYHDESVVAGTSYRYLLTLVRQGESYVHATANIVIPKDLEINHTLSVSEISGIHRLFLGPKTRIIAGENRLSIRVHEIISQGASIESLDSEKTGTEYQGKSGGFISIKAKVARDDLSIKSLGGDGYTGSAGMPGQQGRQGNPGHNAIALVREFVGIHPDFGYLEKKYPGCDPMWQNWQVCFRHPSNGEDGGPGTRGGKGWRGGNGGHSAAFYVEIADESHIKINPIIRTGRAGKGGHGGAGGVGGYGGQAGSRDPHCVCNAAKNGQIGPTGAEGSAGEDGKDGEEKPYCIKIGKAIYGDCTKFAPEGELVN